MNEIDLGFERGAPGDGEDGEAEAAGDARDQQLREEEHEEGADAVDGGGVGVVEAPETLPCETEKGPSAPAQAGGKGRRRRGRGG